MNANDIFENEKGQARVTPKTTRHGIVKTISRKSHHKSDFYNTTRTIYSFLIHFDCIVQGDLYTHTEHRTHSIMDKVVSNRIPRRVLPLNSKLTHPICFVCAMPFRENFWKTRESGFLINLCIKIFAHLILGEWCYILS